MSAPRSGSAPSAATVSAICWRRKPRAARDIRQTATGGRMREFDERSITAAVLARMDQCDDPRFRQVMSALGTPLHDCVLEVRPTEAEWIGAIQFLTEVGQTCTEKRQEYILLSDTLGVSILVITQNHPAVDGTTDSTVLGPYYWEG